MVRFRNLRIKFTDFIADVDEGNQGSLEISRHEWRFITSGKLQNRRQSQICGQYFAKTWNSSSRTQRTVR